MAREYKPSYIFRVRYVYHDDDDDDDDDEDEDETRRAMIGWKDGETEKKRRRDAAEDSRFRNAVLSCLSTQPLKLYLIPRHHDPLLLYPGSRFSTVLDGAS